MFSPAARRSQLDHRDAKKTISPSTPASGLRRSIIPNRPVTGTPAPWHLQSSIPPRPSMEDKLRSCPEEARIGSSKPHGGAMTISETHLDSAVPSRTWFETADHGDKQGEYFTGNVHKIEHDEESESIITNLFHKFLESGEASDSVAKLQEAGAFERCGEANIFAYISKDIIDTLAKHWTSTRGAEIVAATVISSQLADKQEKHMKFLQFLSLSKCHEKLCITQRSSLQIIMEHGEKLACMIHIRELQNIIGDRGANHLDSNPDIETSHSLLDLIQLVGERAHQNIVFLIDRDNAEVFYSKVSEIEEIFSCVDNCIERLISRVSPFMVQVQRACELSNICVTLIQTATGYMNENHVWYPSSEGLKPWYCLPIVCKGMWKLALVIIRLSNEKNKFDGSAKPKLYSHLELLTEILLDAYVVALTANMESKEGQKGLLEEYHDARDTLFDCLYDQVRYIARLGYKENYENDKENKTRLKKLAADLLLIAKRHESYQTIWQMCCDFNDQAFLQNLMHENIGSRGGFSRFVFTKLLEEKQFSKLLRVGEEFPEELALFLKPYPNLLWLHQIFIQQFAMASETLHILALSQKSGSHPNTDAREFFQYEETEPTLEKRRHLFNLAKIATAAGNEVGHVIKMKRLDADMRILELQEQIMPSVEGWGEDGRTGLVPPLELIDACLNHPGRGLVLHAFDVFACTSLSFRQQNKSRLVECWRAAAEEDEWDRIGEACGGGGSDGDMLRVMAGTVLFRASQMCYGPEADPVEVGFEKVLPVRGGERSEDDDQTAHPCSVEEVLRLHHGYPKAGKLMLTAVVLGAQGCVEETRGSEMQVE